MEWEEEQTGLDANSPNNNIDRHIDSGSPRNTESPVELSSVE